MRRKVLLVYPKQGFSGIFIKHTPLSLLYSAAELVKRGVEVEILDNRLCQATWRQELRRRLGDETLLVGISVMSGRPIENAIEIGRYVKSLDPEIRVAWGGPHATFAPESIYDEPSVDFVVSGYGSVPLDELVRALIEGKSDLSHVKGLAYRTPDGFLRNPELKEFEKIPFRDSPYHLTPDYRPYGQFDEARHVFRMYSELGCPYHFTLCSSP